MGIPRVVGKSVVPPMVGDPTDHGALQCERPGEHHRKFQQRRRPKTLMRESPVKPDAHTQAGNHVEHQERADLDPPRRAVPKIEAGVGGADKRRADQQAVHQPLFPGVAATDRNASLAGCFAKLDGWRSVHSDPFTAKNCRTRCERLPGDQAWKPAQTVDA